MTVPVEIERKFVVTDVPRELVAGPGAHLRQGYVATDGDVEVRVRIVDEVDAYLTVKAGRGMVRTEVEVPVGLGQAEVLWPHTARRRVEKVRHELELEQRRIDLDVYGADLLGLCTAEVEFATEAEAAAFAPPPWFDREVTGEPGWDNASLACHGIPD